MTTITNSYHGTSYRTIKSLDAVDRIVEKAPWLRTPAEKAWVRQVRSALCGVSDCCCTHDDLGRRT